MGRKQLAINVAKSYDFTTAEELYEYLWQSSVNGQRKQVFKIWGELGVEDRKRCMAHLQQEMPQLEYISLLELLLLEFIPAS